MPTYATEDDSGGNRLIVFTRYPEPGRTKTRLAAVLGAHGAAELQRQMTERTLQCAREFRDRFEVSLEVRYEGGDEERMKIWLSDGLHYRPQGRGDLGDRMNRAFCEAFEEGVGRAVLVGTDCPGLTVGILNRAFGALRSHNMVLGPAKDGGYYLIGLRVAIPSLFSDIPWGTGEVLAQTKRIAEALGLAVTFVDVLEDVDRIKDLRVYERFMKK